MEVREVGVSEIFVTIVDCWIVEVVEEAVDLLVVGGSFEEIWIEVDCSRKQSEKKQFVFWKPSEVVADDDDVE